MLSGIGTFNKNIKMLRMITKICSLKARAFLVAQKKTLSIPTSRRKGIYRISRAPEKVFFSTVANLICQYQEPLGKAWDPESKNGAN